MAKVMYLSAWFLLGCIISSSITWLGSLHESLRSSAIAIQVFLFALTAMAWLADDAVSGFLRLKQSDYYGLLIAIKIALLTGGVLQWLLG
jgi:fucose 4-O-acetylase-like acetyltransferase